MLRKVIFLSLITVLTAVMTACAGDNKQAGGDEKKDPVTVNKPDNNKDLESGDKAESSDELVELAFFSIARDSEESFNERMGNAISKKFPNITINYIERTPNNDMQHFIVTNPTIDLIFGSIGSWADNVIAHGLEYDMTDLIRKHDVDLTQIEPTLIDAMKQMGDGQIYGIPYKNSTRAIFYNKDIFDKFNVDYPTDGMTWDEFYVLSQKLYREENGEYYTPYSPSPNHMVLINAFSLPSVDPETKRSTFGDLRWQTIVQQEFLQFANHDIYRAASAKYRKNELLNLDTFIKDQTLAMYSEGEVLPIVLPDEMSSFNWDIVAMPTYKENPGVGYQAYPSYISIPVISENKDWAMEVIKFLLTEEFQKSQSRAGVMTALQNKEVQEVMGQDSNFPDKNWGAFFYNKFAPIAPKTIIEQQIRPPYGVLKDKLVPLMNGEIDINTALRQAEEEVNYEISSIK